VSETEVKPLDEKKGGPYSAKERRIRRERVAELFFEKGFPTLEISRMLDVNRNTVTNDLKYCNSKLAAEYNTFDVNTKFLTQLHRMEVQRRRLVDLLLKQIPFKERLVLEKMITDIDYKVLQSVIRIYAGPENVENFAVSLFNSWAKHQNPSYKGLLQKSIVRVSTEAEKKINDIIDEDRKKSNSFDEL